MTATVRIQTAWAREPGTEDTPWLISAYDEFTEDAHGGKPEGYIAAIADDAKDFDVREIEIHVPQHALLAAFAIPRVDGTVTA